MVKDVIYSTIATDYDHIYMGVAVSAAIYILRDFLFDSVYESYQIKREFKKARKIIRDLYEHFLDHIDHIEAGFSNIRAEKKMDRHRMVCDFIAGMTDRFALMTYERLFLPQEWQPGYT